MSEELVLEFKIDEQPFSLVLRLDEPPTFGFSPRELGRVRRMTGLAGLEILRAAGEQDAEVLAMLAIIAAARAGQVIDEDKMLDGKVAWSVHIPGPEAPAAVPPTVAVVPDAPEAA